MPHPRVHGVVAPHDLAPVIGVHLDGEHAADRPVVGEPRLAAQVLQLLDAVTVPQYPVAPTLTIMACGNVYIHDRAAESERWDDRIPRRRSPLLLGLGRLAGVGVGVLRVLVRRREADLAFLPPSEHPSSFPLDQKLHEIAVFTVEIQPNS